MSRTPLFVGLDVGGTSMKAGLVGLDGQPLSDVSLPTEAYKGQEHGLKRMEETILAAIAAAGKTLAEVAAIGVATPGIMDIPRGIITDPPNLKPWKNVPVRQHIADVFQLPTAFQNDANAAAMGEFWAGAGKEVDSMVLFTLGTGIGGGIIVDGKVIEGKNSAGGELGHMKIELTNPRLCGCGKRGCLEAYASASSVARRAREAVAAGAVTRLSEIKFDDHDLTSRDIFRLADEGDAVARQLVDETAYYLAVGASNMMHITDPEMIVFGGGMIAAGEPFLDKIRQFVQEVALPAPAANTLIRYARLGSDAGFIGAAACARQLWEKEARG